MKYCVGLDLSLTGTGIVVLSDAGDIIHQDLISTKASSEIEFRLHFIAGEIIDKLLNYLPSNIVIYMEGLSFGSKGSSILELAGLHYFIRTRFYDMGYNYKVIEPTKLKKFITGSGKSPKSIIIKEIYKKWGEDFNNDNIADAYALAKFSQQERK